MNERIVVPHLIKNLSNEDIEFVLSTLISLVNYRQNPESLKVIPDREYHDIKTLWNDVIQKSIRAECTIKLNKFLLSEWFPRSPGLFYTKRAKVSRIEAMYCTESYPSHLSMDRIDDADELLKKTYSAEDHIEPDFTWIFNPQGKISMINGGIGSIRMTHKFIEGEKMWLMSASSTTSAHEGFPLAVPDKLYNQIIDRVMNEGCTPCNLIGKLRYIPRDFDRLYYQYTGVPQLYLSVNEIEQINSITDIIRDFRVSVPVTFESEYEGYSSIYASYVTFFPGIRGSMERRLDWLENTYVKGKYNGRIVTDFDEGERHFKHAIFSLDRVMNNTLSKKQISEVFKTVNNYYGDVSIYIDYCNEMSIKEVHEMTQERVINIGEGASVSAPVFIADTIENCFNNMKDSDIDKNIESLLKELLVKISEVSNKVSRDQKKHTEIMARDAESLVREATSSNPRRKWYEISLGGLKEAAKSVGEIAKPVLDVLGKLAPLLI